MLKNLLEARMQRVAGVAAPASLPSYTTLAEVRWETAGWSLRSLDWRRYEHG